VKRELKSPCPACGRVTATEDDYIEGADGAHPELCWRRWDPLECKIAQHDGCRPGHYVPPGAEAQ
jgi:hypothetical protein